MRTGRSFFHETILRLLARDVHFKLEVEREGEADCLTY